MVPALRQMGTGDWPLAQPAAGCRPSVPPPSDRNPSWSCDRDLYRRRNERCKEVERFFWRLKRFRRIATRSDILDLIFLSFIHLRLR